MEKRTAVVFGATGLVGRRLIEQLCEREEYIDVIAVSRRKIDFVHPKFTQKIHSLDELTESDVAHTDDVFCCLGTTIKKAKTKEQFEKVDFEFPLRIASLAKNQGVEHFIVITAMGASEKSMAYYSRVKGKLEAELEKLQLPKLSFVRPSLLTGDRDEFRFGERMGEAVLKVLNPLLVGGMKNFRSIEAKQVAKAMIAIALTPRKESVKIFKSKALLEIEIPESKTKEEEKIDKDPVFNWDKMKQNDGVLDEDVTFDRSKIKTIENDDFTTDTTKD